MTFIKEKIYNVFKWDLKELLKSIIGIFLFSIAINLFIVPNNLYNGGVLGISQLLRTLIVNIFDLNINFDISGILNFLINVPLFVLAYHKISKSFFSRTLLCVLLQTIFLTFIPTLEVPLVNELITSVLIGGILAGIGCGMTLSAGASGGGTDIINQINSKYLKMSIGKSMLYTDGTITLSSAVVSDANGVTGEKPLFFFLERYMQSFTDEVAQFVDAIENDKDVPVGIHAGMQSVKIGLAAKKSVEEHRPVKLSEIF